MSDYNSVLITAVIAVPVTAYYICKLKFMASHKRYILESRERLTKDLIDKGKELDENTANYVDQILPLD